MKLKTNFQLVKLIILLLVGLNLYAQKTNTKLEGIVKNDSIYLENINIINKTQNLGTSSDQDGKFVIYATLGDSILFSSVNYTNRIIKITNAHINNRKIDVYLEPGYNELDEVLLEQKIRLDFGKIDMQKGIVLEKSENTYKKAPNARNLTDPTHGNTGVNFISIFKLITKKLRLKRKDKKILQEQNETLQKELPDKLFKEYETSFFTEWLNIPEDEIYQFLHYCQDNGLNEFIRSDEIHIKNFLIQKSKEYQKIKN